MGVCGPGPGPGYGGEGHIQLPAHYILFPPPLPIEVMPHASVLRSVDAGDSCGLVRGFMRVGAGWCGGFMRVVAGIVRRFMRVVWGLCGDCVGIHAGWCGLVRALCMCFGRYAHVGAGIFEGIRVFGRVVRGRCGCMDRRSRRFAETCIDRKTGWSFPGIRLISRFKTCTQRRGFHPHMPKFSKLRKFYKR